MKIYAREVETGKCFRLEVSQDWASRHDNGALISCGLEVPDDLPESTLGSLLAIGKARECSYEEWNHSGCQSRCKLKGDLACQW